MKPLKQAPCAVHLFTDASVYLPTKVSAWAGVIIRDMGTSIMLSGVTGEQGPHSPAVEVMAARYALQGGAKRDLIIPGDTVIINTDFKELVSAMRGRVEWKDARMSWEFEQLRQLEASLGIILCARHVHGHAAEDTGDWRCIINRHVDQEARRIARKEHKRRLAENRARKLEKKARAKADANA